MKNFFRVELKCPYCRKTFRYNIISFKARCVCPHCEYGLIVRTKMSVTILLSIFGFILLAFLNQLLGISRMSDAVNLIYWIVGCLLFVAFSYKVLCILRSPEKIYLVDMEDPTVLERKKREKNGKS